MRRTLTFLAVVALVVFLAGVINRAVFVDLSYLVGTEAGVSLFWVAVGVAVVVAAAGMIGALLARQAAVRAQRKLEAELEEVYRRLREAEARAARLAAAAQEASARMAVAVPGAPASQDTAARTAVLATDGADDRTVVAPAVAETSVTAVAVAAGEAAPAPAQPAAAGTETAVTRVTPAPAEPSVEAPRPDPAAATSVTRVVPADPAGSGTASPGV